MKVNEIISEERTDEILGTLAKGAAALFRGAKTGVQALPAVRPVAKAGEIAARYRDLPKWWGNIFRARDLKALKAARATYRARVVNVAADSLGDDILKWAGRIAILDGIYDYYTAKFYLDDQLKKGMSQEEYDDALTKLRGQFWTAILVPRMAGSISKGTTNVIGAIVTKLGGPRAGEAIRFWGGTMAKGGEAAALAFFSTDKGKQWLADSVGFLVTGFGNAGDLMASFLDYGKAIYQVATGNLPQGYDQKPKDGEKDDSGASTWGGEIQKNLGGGKMFGDPWKGTGVKVDTL